MNHTPGPWTTELGNNHIKIWGKLSRTGAKLIAEVRNENGVFSTSGQQEQNNARLIAAAPELLAIVKEFIQDYQALGVGDGETVEKAQRIIAKAEGKEGRP